MERCASQLEAEEVVERHESAHQQKPLRKEHQLAWCAQIGGEPMTKAAFGIGVVAQHRGESARIGCELDEPHGRQPAEHRDGEDADAPAGHLGNRAGDQPSEQSADRRAADEYAGRSRGVHGIHLFRQVSHRDGGHAADHQTLNETTGEKQRERRSEGHQHPDQGGDGDRNRDRLHPADAVGQRRPWDDTDRQTYRRGRNHQRGISRSDT